MCAGFPAGGVAHQLVNRTGADVVYLEIGDRTPGDEGSYPRDDLAAVARARWRLGLYPQGRHALLDPRSLAASNSTGFTPLVRVGGAPWPTALNPMPLVDPVHRFVLFTNAKCGGTTLKAWFFENLDFATLHWRPATLVGAFGPAYATAHLRRGWRLARRAARAAPGSSDHKEGLRVFVTFYRRAYCAAAMAAGIRRPTTAGSA